jgi:hypothetical protein
VYFNNLFPYRPVDIRGLICCCPASILNLGNVRRYQSVRKLSAVRRTQEGLFL